jgi:hypothetical protein
MGTILVDRGMGTILRHGGFEAREARQQAHTKTIGKGGLEPTKGF